MLRSVLRWIGWLIVGSVAVAALSVLAMPLLGGLVVVGILHELFGAD